MLKRGSIVLIVAFFVSLFAAFSFSQDVSAKGETYELNADGSMLTVSGGNANAHNSGDSMITLSRDTSSAHNGGSIHAYSGTFNISGDRCEVGATNASLVVSLDTSTKTVVYAETSCANYSPYYGNDSATWDQGANVTYTQASGGSSGSGSSNSKPDTSSSEEYTFSSDDGTSIKACKGIFNQFADGCVNFAFDESFAASEVALTDDGKFAYGARAVANFTDCTVNFIIGIPESRTVSSDGKMNGAINYTSMNGSGCGSMSLKGIDGFADGFIRIAISGADELDSLFGGPAIAEEATTSCAIDGIGWIVCPVINFIGSIMDGMYQMISEWLEINPSLVSTDGGTHNGWSVMRDIANVGLVIVFILIIFSQLTSVGISNYGVKKMLPRLIIAAILINVSFFICQLAVDISNILGVSINNILTSSDVFSTEGRNFWSEGSFITDVVFGALAGATTVAGIAVAGVVLGTAAFFGGIGLLIMILLAGLIAVAVMFLILAARMALTVVLVVVSPLAFMAMVLPNTKSLYDRWQKMFVAVLVIFPMMAVVFGGAQMASNIIIQTSAEAGSVSNGVAILALGIGVATIPLFAAIPMLKGSLNAVPMVGKFAQKLSNAKPFRGQIKAGMKTTGTGIGNTARLAAMNGRFGRIGTSFAGGRARRAQKAQELAGNIQRSEVAMVSTDALEEGSDASIRQQATAVSAQKRLEEEEISNIMALDTYEDRNAKWHLERVQNKDASSAERIASIRAVGKIGGQGDKNTMATLSTLGHLGSGERQAIVEMAASSMGQNNPAYGGQSIGEMGNGTFDSDTSYRRYAASTEFNTRSFANMHSAARNEMLSSITKGPGEGASKEVIAAHEASVRGLETVLSQIKSSPEIQSGINPAVVKQLEESVERARNASLNQPAQPSQEQSLSREDIINAANVDTSNPLQQTQPPVPPQQTQQPPEPPQS